MPAEDASDTVGFGADLDGDLAGHEWPVFGEGVGDAVCEGGAFVGCGAYVVGVDGADGDGVEAAFVFVSGVGDVDAPGEFLSFAAGVVV